MLRRSCFVVTNSFHDTVFSLLFHKPFIVLLQKGLSIGMNSRITSLLDVVGLQHRVVMDYDRNQIVKLCYEEVDWSQTDARIREFRECGCKFLSDALK